MWRLRKQETQNQEHTNYLVRTVHPQTHTHTGTQKTPPNPQTTMSFPTRTCFLSQLLVLSSQTPHFTVFFPSQLCFPVTNEHTWEETMCGGVWDILYMMQPYLFDVSFLLCGSKFSGPTKPQLLPHQQKQENDLRLPNAFFWSAAPLSALINCIPVLRIYKLTSALDTTEDVLKTGAENKCLSLLQEQTAILSKCSVKTGTYLEFAHGLI